MLPLRLFHVLNNSGECSIKQSETPSETRTSERVAGDVAYCLQASRPFDTELAKHGLLKTQWRLPVVEL